MAKETKELDEIIKKSASGKIDSKKLNTIIDKIEKENTKFIDKNKEMLTGIAPHKKVRVEVDLEEEKQKEK